MSDPDKEFLLSICYGDVPIDQVSPQRIIDAIKSVIRENDELRGIQRNEQGEEIMTADEIVEDEERYL